MVRYADYPIPQLHLYRDYVIDSFNRDKPFSSWLDGKSDDYGIDVAKDMVHFHDFHTTILRLLGMDHTKLTYRYAGRDFRLTDVHGNAVKSLRPNQELKNRL